MNNVLSVFNDVMKREGKTIYSYADNAPYTVFFRRNSDRNSTRDTITIFYPVEAGIKAGQLLKYKDKVFLTINAETIENEVYNKSDLFETNAIIQYVSGGQQINHPVYAYDLQSPLSIDSSVISVTGGNIKILAEENTITKKLKIGDTFYCVGGHWEIDNLIYKDNIIYIYVERALIAPEVSLEINAEGSYFTADTPLFTALATINGLVDDTATITWASSDENICTVDDGQAAFHKAGNVTISVTWLERDITASKAIVVVASEVPLSGSCYIANGSGDEWTERELRIGKLSVWYALFKDNDGNVVDGITPVWSMDGNSEDVFNKLVFECPTNDNPLRATLTPDDDTDLIGQEFNLNLTDSAGAYGSYVVRCYLISSI